MTVDELRKKLTEERTLRQRAESDSMLTRRTLRRLQDENARLKCEPGTGVALAPPPAPLRAMFSDGGVA
jgi:hypothetical protein